MITSSGLSLRALFRDHYKPLRLRGKSADNTRLYGTSINNFERFLCREPMAADLDSDALNRFMGWVIDRGRSPATANGERNRLMALARFAESRGYITAVPEVLPEPEPERAARAWMDSDLDVLFRALATLEGVVCGVPAALWWTALHLVCLFTAERIMACLSLRWCDLDLESGWLIVQAESRKGKTRDLECRLPPEVVAVLRQMRAHNAGELIFPTDFHWTTLYNRYKVILKRAGLPHDRKSKFHRIRKTTASNFHAAGGNATALLDHSNTNVTRRYLDKRIATTPSAGDVLAVPPAAIEFLGQTTKADPQRRLW